jgi:hypothetical protein
MTFIKKQEEIALWSKHDALKACRVVDAGLHAFYNYALGGGERAASRYCRLTPG